MKLDGNLNCYHVIMAGSKNALVILELLRSYMIKSVCSHYYPAHVLFSLTSFMQKFHSGVFTENSFVLAEGWYEDDIFHVTAFGFPPAETSKTTR